MNKEIWKDIVGHKGLYQVSNLGNIRGLDRRVKQKDGKTKLVKGKILKTYDRKGYKHIKLYKQNRVSTFSVHSLVLSSFEGERPKKKDINHKNGNKKDNRLENLEYVTRGKNNEHARYVLGKKCGLGKGDTHYNSKLTTKQAKAIKNKKGKLVRGDIKRLAKQYGVTPGCIQGVLSGRTWTHI